MAGPYSKTDHSFYMYFQRLGSHVQWCLHKASHINLLHTHTLIYSLLPPFLSIIHTQHTRAFECGTRKCSPSIWSGWITPSRVPSVDSSDSDLGGVASLLHGSPDNAFKLGQTTQPTSTNTVTLLKFVMGVSGLNTVMIL